ncbi:unnamed protein product [Camellia sinensis]
MEEALEMEPVARSNQIRALRRQIQPEKPSKKSLSSLEVTSLVDCCLDLLKDNNFRVSQGALQALASAAVLSDEHLKLHFNALVPATVERLGDAKQPVRDAARRLLLTLMEEMYTQAGPQFRDELQRHHLPTSLVRDSDVTEKSVDSIKVYSERYAVVPDDNVKRINFVKGKI